MRTRQSIFLLMILVTLNFLSIFSPALGSGYADTTVILEQPVHFTTAEGVTWCLMRDRMP